MRRIAWVLLGHTLLMLAGSAPKASEAAAYLEAPGDVRGVALSESSIQWEWSRVLGATRYVLHEDGTHAFVGEVQDPASYFVETGLAENTRYSRHVHAVFYTDTSAPSVAARRYTWVHPATTGDFTVTPKSASEIKIVVKPPRNSAEDLTGVEINRTSPSSSTVSSFSPVYEAIDSGLQPGTEYCFAIEFRNGDGIASGPSPSSLCAETADDSSVIDCKLSATIRVLKRRVSRMGGDDSIEYEFEVKTVTPHECLEAKLTVRAEIAGDARPPAVRHPGGVTVANTAPNTFLPRVLRVTEAEKTFGPTDGLVALFERADIANGLGRITAGSERLVIYAELRSDKCGCEVSASLAVPQANLGELPHGETTDGFVSTNCKPTIVPFYAFVNPKVGDPELHVTYKVTLQPECVMGTVRTLPRAFVTVNGQRKEVFPFPPAPPDQHPDSPKGRVPQLTVVPAPSFTLLHEFKASDIDKKIDEIAGNASPDEKAKIRESLVFFVNTRLHDACNCILSLSKEVKGISVPAASTPCGLKVTITIVERELTATSYRVTVAGSVVVPDDCTQKTGAGRFREIPPAEIVLQVTGTHRDQKGNSVAFVLGKVSRNSAISGAAEPGPLVAPFIATLEIPKEEMNQAVQAKGDRYAGDESLKTSISISVKDHCGCAASDAKSFKSPDVRTEIVPLTRVQNQDFLDCKVSLIANVSAAIQTKREPTSGTDSPKRLIIVVTSVCSIEPECVPARLQVGGSLSVGSNSVSELVLGPTRTIEASQALISFTKELEVTKELNDMLQRLSVTFWGELSDSCGCLITKGLKVKVSP